MTNANLAAALAEFQAEMPTVHKGKTATVPTKTGGSYKYTYADLADVTAAATPVLTKHGLSFSAQPRRTEQGDYELEGVLLHSSGERETGSLPIFGRTAQEIGSSLTYGRRYLLGCLTGIVTDDDDDAATANPSERTRRQAPPPDPAAEAKKEAWRAWLDSGKTDGREWRDAYEQWCAQPFDDAEAPDFRAFAKYLREGK